MPDAVPLKMAQPERLNALVEMVETVFHGKREVVRLATAALLARGHILFEDIPGVGKTTLARALAATSGLGFRRVQFTSDLLPSDVLGVSIYNPQTASFETRTGPIFTNIVVADEINRAPPRTQAALLEAMQEHRVTVAGETMTLPEPFFVLATQNPIEQEGTYPLPEAQLDRFLFDIRVAYPDERAEVEILRNTTGRSETAIAPVIDAAQTVALQRMVRDVPAADVVLQYAARLVRATRPDDAGAPDSVTRYVRWGAGPRAGQALILGAKAHALLAGRHAVAPDDIRRVAHPVLRHRVLPNFAAEAEGVSAERIVDELLAHVPPPKSDIRI